ncbi:RNA polymerase sigma-70 factor, ECF subfamily [Bacillus sp. OV166]|uniref:RNA polymerase sigma factor n=1 Tax=Bacillus sp. OV166 TaxID=1882763 RepID=UPI000A2AB301|nr:antiterminator Q family protein [Bacillus sp. OV166]SMQ80847.1 RNA polymerase sigma-70 factor, ECF subfamily [Bacillus sp. OV166]
MNEDDLIIMSIKGDNNAFSSLVNPYIKQAHQTAFLLLHDYSLAEDAVQEALIQVNTVLKRYKSHKGSFKTWFIRIIINCSLKINRKHRLTFELKDNQFQDTNSNIERNYLVSEESQLIINCVKQLKTKYQSVIILYYFQEMTIREIADTLGIREGTVKSRLYKSRELLKNMLENNYVIPSKRGEGLWNEN